MGFLLEVAEQAGLRGLGARSESRGRARRQSNASAIGCSRASSTPSAFPGVAFDAVTLIDVLEHVPDPAALLATVHGRLAPGGVLAAVLPNAASLTRRLLGRRWPHYAPEHLFFWTPAALARQLAAAGFEVREIRTGIRKTYTGGVSDRLRRRAPAPGSRPGLRWLGQRTLRVPTGEMLALAVRR